MTGSIIVTDFRCKFSFFPFILINKVTIRSTQILFRVISLYHLAGNLPYLFLSFCKLESVTTSYYLLDGVYNYMPLQILANCRLRYFHSYMK